MWRRLGDIKAHLAMHSPAPHYFDTPWDDLEIAIPAFLTIVLMPFTYSISVGIGAGFVAYVLIKIVRGRAGLVHPLLWVVSALFVVYFFIQPVKQALGV